MKIKIMPLTMRPSGLASTGYYKDHANYLVFWVTRTQTVS